LAFKRSDVLISEEAAEADVINITDRKLWERDEINSQQIYNRKEWRLKIWWR